MSDLNSLENFIPSNENLREPAPWAHLSVSKLSMLYSKASPRGKAFMIARQVLDQWGCYVEVFSKNFFDDIVRAFAQHYPGIGKWRLANNSTSKVLCILPTTLNLEYWMKDSVKHRQTLSDCIGESFYSTAVKITDYITGLWNGTFDTTQLFYQTVMYHVDNFFFKLSNIFETLPDETLFQTIRDCWICFGCDRELLTSMLIPHVSRCIRANRLVRICDENEVIGNISQEIRQTFELIARPNTPEVSRFARDASPVRRS